MNPCPVLFVWWVWILFCSYCITFLSSPLIFHECSPGHSSPFSAWRVSIEINGHSSCGWREEYTLISALLQEKIIHWKEVLVSVLKVQVLLRQIIVWDPNKRSSTEERTAHAKSKQKPRGFLNVETKLRETQWLYSPVKCTVSNLVLR